MHRLCPHLLFRRTLERRKATEQTYSEEDLFNEFTRDENGNVVLSQEEAEDKIQKLGGYDKLYRIKLEADYLKKLAFDGAKKDMAIL